MKTDSWNNYFPKNIVFFKPAFFIKDKSKVVIIDKMVNQYYIWIIYIKTDKILNIRIPFETLLTIVFDYIIVSIEIERNILWCCKKKIIIITK